VGQRLDRYVLEPSCFAVAHERPNEHILLEHSVVANGRGRDGCVGVPASRLREQRHPSVGEHSCHLADGACGVRHVVDGAEADDFLKHRRLERERFDVAGDGADSPASARSSGAKHIERDVNGDRRSVQPPEQVGTPAPARPEIEDEIVGGRLQGQHRHGKVLQHAGAFLQRVQPRGRERLRALPRGRTGSRQIRFLGLFGVCARHCVLQRLRGFGLGLSSMSAVASPVKTSGSCFGECQAFAVNGSSAEVLSRHLER